MDINLTPRDRAAMLGAACEQTNDPVAIILQKAKNYDQAKDLVKSSMNRPEDADDLDLITLIKAMLQTLKEADQYIKTLRQKTATLDDQLKKLAKVCEEQGIDLGLSKDLKLWMSQK